MSPRGGKPHRRVTLRDVAAAADLGLADLYRLYPDKVALLAAFMARSRHRLYSARIIG